MQPVYLREPRAMHTSAGKEVSDLKEGRLRDIAAKIERLSGRRRRQVADEVMRRLEEVVRYDALSPRHRWMITALQYLALPEAADLLIRALLQSINMENCCGCTQNRIMRALGAVRPPEAVPPLVDVICREDSPAHKHLAAVCIRKILKAHRKQARALLRYQRPRLQHALRTLKTACSRTRPVNPPKPWVHLPGSPGWLKAMERAIKAVERLLDTEGGGGKK
jgi:HEAT repeat protein